MKDPLQLQTATLGRIRSAGKGLFRKGVVGHTGNQEAHGNHASLRKTANWAPFVPSSLSLLIPLEVQHIPII